jgi:dTDP-4-dehydrorhamnose reductase
MSTAKTILITGANGQLGQCFKALSNSFSQFHFLFTDRNTLQITDAAAIDLFFTKNNIDVCINCAAYTAVDKAETQKDLAIEVNTNAVGYLAKICATYNAQFIHISTDYVFDGTATAPYKTDDKTNPVNFYGQTKLDGELNAIKENKESIIIRTAWVYSEYGNNFVKTMLRLMKERESIGVVNDQRGAPTYAPDLAAAILQIIDTNNFTPGIYHFSNKGNISWYDFAKEIAHSIDSKCIVNPISTTAFPTAAKRPKYSVLETNKLENTFSIIMQDWAPALKKCISKMMK